MDEEIVWHPLGTVTFRGFKDQDRELRRPTFGQLRHFSISLKQIADETTARAEDLRERIAQAEEDGDEDKVRVLVAEVNDFAAFGFIDMLLVWYRDVFNQLSDPLPEDDNILPAYFADPSLAPEVVNHWKLRPKASGRTAAQ